MRMLILAGITALMATGAIAQQETALQLALRQQPVPCGSEANILAAQFGTGADDRRVIRVTCADPLGTAPEGAPATNVVPLIGALAPVLGLGAAAAAVAAAGSGGGSSTPDTQ